MLTYIPFFGWALLLNFASSWYADNTLVNGKQVKYSAGYGESLKFVSINFVFLVVTLGIYTFWFYPKLFRYIVGHTTYTDLQGSSPSGFGPQPSQGATLSTAVSDQQVSNQEDSSQVSPAAPPSV